MTREHFNMAGMVSMLIPAASHVGAHIRPEVVDGPDGPLIHLDERDLQALRRAADQGPHASSASSRLRQMVTVRGDMRNLAMSEDAARRLLDALRDLDRATNRDRQVRNGTFTGPMSGREVVEWTLARARRGLR